MSDTKEMVMKPVEIRVTQDFVCPWCWIGHQNLKTALESTAGTAVSLRYAPYELNPGMPKEGVSRKEYRTTKFGSWARSQAMDAEVATAGKRAGIDFNYDRVAVTPNSRLAHRLMVLAQDTGTGEQVEALVEAIFAAYFSRGENIGTLDVLVALAVSAGFDAAGVRSFLEGDGGEDEVARAELDARQSGVTAVPSFSIGGHSVRGAQPPAILVQAIGMASANHTAVAG
jgi:predicted DsbA family dithiol-disulfide isomerase